jgi:acetyl-CoA acetyltransferase
VNGHQSGGRPLQALDRAIKQQVPGYKLHTLEASGAQANLTAIHLLTNSELKRALFAVGSEDILSV